MNDTSQESPLAKLKRYDDMRPGIPGEHWLTLAAGLGVWWVSRSHRSPVVRTLGMVAATALVGRAASGRDGLAKVLRWLPVGQGIRPM
ncbi:hypothetical protein [Ramlibacter tataouinensis]|uniref:Uncharacterized protein n=1 Tax=Ramlibacter tataouinensis (strain ATCC BAA-407 / DSM 14655 / LMG 21543 / TTB310) TaxID=365046 RepID=F5Y5Z5_RAMTT|nr:hypothetical protein [Ramlibacter tataouinensis]AEG91499.1 Hypothetical protein Rta_04280 [Ramlibacter tataouinensis TTB310]